MALALIAGLGAVGSIGAGIYGASQASSAQSQAMANTQKYQDLISKELGSSTANANDLLANQRDPADIFSQIFGQLPGEISSAFPTYQGLATGAASALTANNLTNYDAVLAHLYPGASGMNQQVAQQIFNQNPSNLGQAEILGTTRAVSPLIPAGTLDPSTGSVAGGTTSPTSLYRNLVNGMYQQRQQQFITNGSNYVNMADNSASRQQVQASQFLNELLQGSFSLGSSLTGQTVSQDQTNINNAMGQIQTLLGLQASGNFNAAPYTAGITSGVNSASMGLNGLLGILASQNKASSLGGGTASLAGTIQGGANLGGGAASIGSSPSFIQRQ